MKHCVTVPGRHAASKAPILEGCSASSTTVGASLTTPPGEKLRVQDFREALTLPLLEWGACGGRHPSGCPSPVGQGSPHESGRTRSTAHRKRFQFSGQGASAAGVRDTAGAGVSGSNRRLTSVRQRRISRTIADSLVGRGEDETRQCPCAASRSNTGDGRHLSWASFSLMR